MADKTATKGVGSSAFRDFGPVYRSFDGLLHVVLVKMVTPVFHGFRHSGRNPYNIVAISNNGADFSGESCALPISHGTVPSESQGSLSLYLSVDVYL